MHAGVRSSLHNRLRDEVVRLSREALCEPELEVCPFPSVVGNLRVDALLHHVNDEGSVVAVDFAIVNAIGTDHLTASLSGPGAAATAYEEVKRKKYGAACASAGISFVPVIFDVFGGCGASATPLLNRIILRWGKRYDLPPTHSFTIASHRISFVLAKGVARLLVANTAPPEEAADEEVDGGHAAGQV
jgi:hypothetical protein